MSDEVSIAAPDGGVITPAYLQVRGRWPWLVAALGFMFVAVAGMLMSESADDQITLNPATSTWAAR